MNTNVVPSDVFVVIKTDDPRFNSVNARDLHGALEVGTDFSTWIKGRIEKYGFVEGEDFVIAKGALDERSDVADEIYLANFGEINTPDMSANGVANEIYLPKFREINSVDMNYDSVANADSSTCDASVSSVGISQQKRDGRGVGNRIDYIISLDMAKELAMIEANDIGRRVRRYFIAAEKELVKRMRDEYVTAIADKDAEIAEKDEQLETRLKLLGNFMETNGILREVIANPDFKNKAPLDKYVANELKRSRAAFRENADNVIECTMNLRTEINKIKRPTSKDARWAFNDLIQSLIDLPWKTKTLSRSDYI